MPSGKGRNANILVFWLTRSNPRSIALEANTLTITAPIRLRLQFWIKHDEIFEHKYDKHHNPNLQNRRCKYLNIQNMVYMILAY